MLNIGIVGAGAIGKFLLRELKSDPGFQIVALDEQDSARGTAVLKELDLPESILTPLDKFPASTDIFIESASQTVAPTVAKFALDRGKIAIIASIGGLDDLIRYLDIAKKTGGKLILPSGALVGLDALKAIPPDSIKTVFLMSSKPSKTLADTPFLVKQGIDTTTFQIPTLVFEGTAREATKAFPKSANVAAALAFASVGLDNVHVEMWADPESDKNRHTIKVESGHGVFISAVANEPFEENPRTSKLAAYSILAAVRGLSKSIIVGT
jgi:aspartate dehydrogenase